MWRGIATLLSSKFRKNMVALICKLEAKKEYKSVTRGRYCLIPVSQKNSANCSGSQTKNRIWPQLSG